MPTFHLDMKKLVIWLAMLPLVIILGAVAFSPKGAVTPTAQAQATPDPASASAPVPNAPVLKPTALPVMYEFFTGW